MKKKPIDQMNNQIDLMELLYTYLRKWWMIAAGAISGAIIAMTVTMCLITPKYESKAMLYVLNKTTSLISMADLQFGDALSQDFIVIAKSKPALDKAIEIIEDEEHKTFTRAQLLGMTTISRESRIISIRVVSENAEDACIVANAMAEAISGQVAEIMRTDSPTTLERAEVSNTPVSPDVKRNVMKGFLLGMVLVCGVLTVVFVLNDRIKTQEDVENYLDVPALAVIPYIHEKEWKRELKKKHKMVK